MIRSRGYAVPLVGVLLALATGIALGAGPLTDTGSSAAPGPAVHQPAPQAGYADAFAGAVATRLYGNGLSRRPVAVLTAPGADPATVAAVTAQVKAAGGQVSGTYALGSQLVDPQQKSLVDTLGAELGKQLHAHLDRSATTYPRIGELLAVAAANRGNSVGQVNDDVSAVRQSMVAAHLVTVPHDAQGNQPGTAPLVLLVLGHDLDQAIADGLVSGLAARSRGVVVIGDTAAPDLVGLRQDGVTKVAAAVDGAETTAGQVASVLALIRSWRTPGGSFGASGVTGAAPLG
ncbi:copper transporter [Nocardioides cynanchi]|uniref:copper transporter n=1 Tax=Nocardioides cynanchi TaxID=2558918 RepID=UPI00177E34E3|nr:copper transporter [Nocardioides cynanchi]